MHINIYSSGDSIPPWQFNKKSYGCRKHNCPLILYLHTNDSQISSMKLTPYMKNLHCKWYNAAMKLTPYMMIFFILLRKGNWVFPLLTSQKPCGWETIWLSWGQKMQSSHCALPVKLDDCIDVVQEKHGPLPMCNDSPKAVLAFLHWTGSAQVVPTNRSPYIM